MKCLVTLDLQVERTTNFFSLFTTFQPSGFFLLSLFGVKVGFEKNLRAWWFVKYPILPSKYTSLNTIAKGRCIKKGSLKLPHSPSLALRVLSWTWKHNHLIFWRRNICASRRYFGLKKKNGLCLVEQPNYTPFVVSHWAMSKGRLPKRTQFSSLLLAAEFEDFLD